MAFTSGNDINILQAADSTNVGAGAGNDRYVLDSSILSAGQQITISDTGGTNTLQLVGGLVITSSIATSDTLVLTLSNGAVVTVLGANLFTFLTGGNPITGTGGTPQPYGTFLTGSLGFAAVPAGATPVNGTTQTVNPNGGTGPFVVVPVSPTFSVAAGAASVIEGASATFTVSLSSAQGTTNTVAYTLAGTGGAVLGTDTTAQATTGTLTFAPGVVTQTIVVAATFDTLVETGEGVSLTLSAPSTGTVLSTTAVTTTVALLDPPVPTFTLTSNAVSGAATTEGNTITYTITPSSITDKAYTFTLTSQGDTLGGVASAASGADFSPAAATVTFAAGSTAAQTVVQTIVADGIIEGLEGYKTSLLNSSLASVASISGLINDGSVAGTVGTTFTLTTGVDVLNGTAADDLIIADNTGTAKQLTAADSLNAGAGIDTLRVFLAAGDTATGQPTLTAIEIVATNGGAVVAYTAATGTTGLIVEAPVANTIATYTLAGQEITLKSFASTAATTTTIAKAATSTITSQKVTLDGVGTALNNTIDVTGTGITTLNLVASGANSAAALANTGGAAITTINISGDKNLSLTESAGMVTVVTTIDASTATGNVSVNTAAATVASSFKFTGGAGNDTVTFANDALGTLISGAQLVGGAGTGDKIGILDTVLTATETARINQATGFEVLGLNAAITLDAGALTSIKSFSVDTTALTQTISNMFTGSTTTITAAAPTSLTLGTNVGITDTSVVLGSAASAGITVGALVTTGITNVRVTSNGTAANAITTLTNTDNSVFTLNGATDLTLTLSAGTAVGSRVDGSAATGKLTLTGSTLTGSGDIIIGGSGADTINGRSGADMLTGGAGVDTFSFTATAAANAGGATFGQADVITDFVIGTDKLQFAGVTDIVSAQQGAVQTAVTALAAGSSDTAIATAMATANTTSLGVSFAVFGGNTYALYETVGASTGVAADDVFIKLLGVTTLPTFAADVVA